jgi:predicted nucleic acid-binding protein
VSAAAQVVVDTNIFFSALIRPDSRFAQTLVAPAYEFHAVDLVVVELFKHKERILAASRLSQRRLTEVFQAYLHRTHLHNAVLLPAEHRREALRLCTGVDESDAGHVALALSLAAPLWTGDMALRRGLEERGFTNFFRPPPPIE